ncbi:MAG: zinc ribbon domain-containing protein [Anaerolineales bacterium]|nr:zinc ribbon domain-containing protein [Anaerolineales bacterium]
MARKVKGYVELYWTCPSCANQNAGSHAYCMSCGSPQPRNVDFHQGSLSQLLTDDEKIRRAKQGADIHCGFCGTRNPAGAKNCSQCQADLTAGARRGSGKVLGAFKPNAQGAVAPLECPSCGALNAGTRRTCGSCGGSLAPTPPPAKAANQAKAAGKPLGRKVFVIVGLVLFSLCAIVYFLFLRTTEIEAIVAGVEWQRSVVVEQYGPVEMEAWLDQVPGSAAGLSCSERVRTTQNQPPSNSRFREVCGTEYVVDTGSGSGEVVQDCVYEVYADYCSYTVDAWAPYDTVELRGVGLSPQWPQPSLNSVQRLGEQEESYICIFRSGGDTYRYQTGAYSQFQRCVTGSNWLLEINSLGGVTSITPAD